VGGARRRWDPAAGRRDGVTRSLEETLVRLRLDGRKAFVPYVMAELPGVDGGFLRSLAGAGADAIEVGVAFSDPVMDGPVIQEAARRALAAGATPGGALELLREAALEIPVVLMSYLNPILAFPMDRFLSEAAGAGVVGVIVPDLPVDEAEGWIGGCREAGIAPVFLAAPNSGPDRLRRIVEASAGFVYCVATLGVTGSRDRLSGSARSVVEALRPLTERPLLVGVGISTPEQAGEACRFADGVVVGSGLGEPILRGDTAEALRRAEAFRTACQ